MLRLVGHYNPVREYPSPVVPICTDLQGRLFAIYTRKQRIRPRELPKHFQFVRHGPQLIEFPATFQAIEHALFAYSAHEVVHFSRRRETDFLRQQFELGTFLAANPFLVLSLAVRAAHTKGILNAMRCCISELGGDDPFARRWYKQQRKRSPAIGRLLPDSFHEFLQPCVFLRIACSLDKETLFTEMCRQFNSLEFGTPNRRLLQVTSLPLNSIAMQESVWDGSVDAVAPESEEWCDRAQVYHHGASFEFAVGWPVLAVSPNFATRLPATVVGWRDVFRVALEMPEFRWIRTRSDTEEGSTIDHAILGEFFGEETFEYDESRHEIIGRLEERVLRYVEGDAEIISAAVVNGEWLADVFVAQEHSIQSLLSDLPNEQRPLLVPCAQAKAVIGHDIVLVGQREESLEFVFSEFCNFVTSEAGSRTLWSHRMAEGGVARISKEQRTMAAGQFKRFQRSLAVCLVADVSGSMGGDKLIAMKAGMLAFLGRLSHDRDDVVALVKFSDEASIVVPMQKVSEIADTIAQQIERLETNGQTALVDGIVLALSKLAPWREKFCAVVAFTDGLENASKMSGHEAAAMLLGAEQEKRMIFGLAFGEDSDIGLLQRFSEMTGGTSYVGNFRNVSLIYEKVASLL